ncbi:hypothetical protein [Bhargavaea cecembensis]|uniref:hypothetical protein n=1 Tax=Bhargavaea cecembensis TaxID=394098 RepID=UPI00058F1D60|nr:hypothetical protein [Bhargavaea cecembensis]
MNRLFLFLFSYGLCVVTMSHLVLFLNYRALGHSWESVFRYIVATPDFKLLVIALIVLLFTVSGRGPLRLPSGKE